MKDWNISNAKPHWSEQEIEHKVRDAFKQAMDLIAAQDGCKSGACDIGGKMW